MEAPTAALVFCRTRTEVDELTETLNGRGYRAEALHGGMDQAQRDRVMGRLRDGTAELLIATDVAARGLDVDTLTHVVNYDVPSAPESYVHRIGRVGRAGRKGVAITLAEPRERRLLANIESMTHQKIAIEPVPSVADLRGPPGRADRGDGARGDGDAGDLDEYAGMLDALTDGAGRRPRSRRPRSSWSTRPAGRRSRSPRSRRSSNGTTAGATRRAGRRGRSASGSRPATVRPRSSTSGWAATAGSVRPTSSAPSPTRAG